jgi:hypothetical protein
MKRSLPPALALFLIAPIFGELFSGSSPLNEYINPVTFITLGLLYGCGAIIVRELTVRWNKGWMAVLLLGMAYGIYEEGPLVQSFFDPGWMDLGNLAVYGRALGVNWVWTEHLTIFHALISISASIAFVEILYPEQRTQSWVTTRGWWIANWAGFIGIYLIWEIFTTYDAGIWKLLSWLTVFGLGLLARFLPTRVLPPFNPPVPPPARFWWTGFLGFFFQFFFIYTAAERGVIPFPVTMLGILLFDLFILWLVLRWSGNGAAWDDRHRLALVNGALMLLLALVPLTSGAQYPITYITNPIFILLLWLAARRVNKQAALHLAPAKA